MVRPSEARALLGVTLFAVIAAGAVVASAPEVVEDQIISLEALRGEHVPVVRQPSRRRRASEPKPPERPRNEDLVAPPATDVQAAAAEAANRAAAAIEEVAGRTPKSSEPNGARNRKERPGIPPSSYALEERLEHLPLSMVDYVNMVRERNSKILAERLEWQVAEEGVVNAKSQFEAEFISTAGHEENTEKNTVQEQLQRSNFADFREFNERYDGAVEQQLITGGKLHTGYHLDSLNNNLQSTANTSGLDTFNEFRTFIGATLTQPILKGAGARATRAKVVVAEKDRDIAFQSYRREMMRVLADAIFAYVELAAAQKRLAYRTESVRIAKMLLNTNRERVKLGMLADTEIMEAQAGLAQREAQLRAAEQDVVVATARVRNFIAAVPHGFAQTSIEATDELVADPINTNLEDSIIMAGRMAPEYLAAKRRAEREGIKLAFARNQREPQLDLKASYGVNGLDTSADKSFHDAFASDNRNWSMYAEIHVPLDGGLKTRSELKVAEYHKKEALLQIKNAEVELTNAVDTALQNVQSAAVQIQKLNEATAEGEHLLDVELKRLEGGLSTSRLVLQREEDLNRVREEHLRTLISYKRAGLELELTRGSLLKRFGMEVTTIGGKHKKAPSKKG